MNTEQPNLLGVIDAIVSGWVDIQRNHPDLPPAIITIGTSQRGDGRVTAGHFAPDRWRAGDAASADARRHEVVITGEGLAERAEGIFGTLLHEAAHALAEARGIKDTSRGHRYHNQKFRKLAEEVGLDVRKDDELGWENTEPRPETIVKYAAAIGRLRMAHDAIGRVHRVPMGAPVKLPPPPRVREPGVGVDDPEDLDGDFRNPEPGIPAGKKLALTCSCGIRIWISSGVWVDKAPQIACLNPGCGCMFEPA